MLFLKSAQHLQAVKQKRIFQGFLKMSTNVIPTVDLGGNLSLKMKTII